MKYLHCVAKETLRLYPAVPLEIPHESLGGVTVGGYYIPEKTTIIINLWAIGRDFNVWGPDSSKFKPERFMEEHMDLTGQSDFSMISFGAGRRGCSGASLAIPSVEIALAQLVHTFDWRVEGDPSQLDMKETCGVAIPRFSKSHIIDHSYFQYKKSNIVFISALSALRRPCTWHGKVISITDTTLGPPASSTEGGLGTLSDR